MNIEYTLAKKWINTGSRVLDLGCGNGELLHYLQTNLDVYGYGIEINPDRINQAIAKGVNVIDQDLNDGLYNFADNSFDTVVMNRTLQSLQSPDTLLLDMLRVGRQVVITFPNFANWQNRMYLGLKGKMPVSDAIPYQWYDTPNIHLSTLKDFEKLCRKHDITILDHVAIAEERVLTQMATIEKSLDRNKQTKKLMPLWQLAEQGIHTLVNKSPNLLAEVAIYRLSK